MSEVRGALSPNAEARDLLEDLLLAAGYLDRHEQLYENVAYVVRSHHAFHVRDGFPRLTETALPPGVGDLAYSVALSNCMPFLVEDEEIRSLLQQSRNA